MAKYFFETSAFTKRYKTELGSEFVNRVFTEEHELFYLNLAIIEIRKVFYRLYKWTQNLENDTPVTKEEFQSLESQFAVDLLTMKRIEFTDEMVEKSIEILEKAWVNSVFDLAQLSAFLIAKEIYPDLIFVCSDKGSNLIRAARLFVGDTAVKTPEGENGLT
jgi:predicted nucleic acid-binding protein